MENVTKFMVYCLEIYKTAHKISGREIIKLFTKYKILEYIAECYGALHTTGPEYIIEDISELIKEKQKSLNIR